MLIVRAAQSEIAHQVHYYLIGLSAERLMALYKYIRRPKEVIHGYAIRFSHHWDFTVNPGLSSINHTLFLGYIVSSCELHQSTLSPRVNIIRVSISGRQLLRVSRSRQLEIPSVKIIGIGHDWLWETSSNGKDSWFCHVFHCSWGSAINLQSQRMVVHVWGRGAHGPMKLCSHLTNTSYLLNRLEPSGPRPGQQ